MAGQRVLLVHDNADCRRIYGAALSHEGYEVAVTEDGDEALDQFSRAPSSWSLIVTDLFVRSRVDECFPRLLKRAPVDGHPRPPVVVLSAWSTEEHRRLANDEGADAYFPLPVPPSDFLIVVHDLLAPEPPPSVAQRTHDRGQPNAPLP